MDRASSTSSSAEAERALGYISDNLSLQTFVDNPLAAKVLDALDIPVFIKDKDCLYLHVNPAYCLMTGMHREDVLGKSVDELFPQEHASRYQKSDSALLEKGGEQRYRSRVLNRLTGRERDVEFHKRALFDRQGHIQGIAGVVVDISSHLHALQKIENLNEQLWNSLISTVEILGRAQEWNDPYTVGHQQRVSELSVSMAREMGLDSLSLEQIRLGSLIHDVGKMRVPIEILIKSEPLNQQEWLAVREHVEHGRRILDGIAMSPEVLEIVENHHERIDGSGYPVGLVGDEISINVRIVSVADTIEAMTQDRPYRQAVGWQLAMQELQEANPQKYDFEVVEAAHRVWELGYLDWLSER